MWCRIVQWLADRRIAAGQSPQAAFVRHAERCQSCRRFIDAAGQLPGRLKSAAADTPPAPPALRARILERIDRAAQPAAAPPPGRQIFRFAKLAVAAGMIATVALSLLLKHSETPARGPQSRLPVVTETGPSQFESALPTVGEPTPVFHESSMAIEDLARDMTTRELEQLLEDARTTGEQLLASLPIPPSLLEADPPGESPEAE